MGEMILLTVFHLLRSYFHDDAYGIKQRGNSAMKKIPAGQFKAQCLAIIDQLQNTGESVLITRRGKPIARLVRLPSAPEDVFGYMADKVKIVGDIGGPITPLEDWEAK
jgi:antitoxin (DNA-binding transcriptional repressor) of toxin-antitoxin stability system